DGAAFASAVRQLVAARREGRTRVVVADDDQDFAEAVRALLESSGMEVRTVAEPTRVLDALEAMRPDLLLLDVNMPGVDGLDVCRMLRITPPWQDLPVLFLTGSQAIDGHRAALLAGGDDYLAKPVDPDELLARIRV